MKGFKHSANEKLIICPIVLIIAMIIVIVTFILSWNYTSSEIERLERDSIELESTIEILTLTVGSFEEQLENNEKFYVTLIRGLDKKTDAFMSLSYADAEYDSASFYYDENYLELAKGFYGSCDVYYGYASVYFSESKAWFEETRKYATTNFTIELSENLINYTEINRQMSSEMHEVCEYFSSASDSYNRGYWNSGDIELEKGNEHIRNHDSLVFLQNDYYNKIKVMLEMR